MKLAILAALIFALPASATWLDRPTPDSVVDTLSTQRVALLTEASIPLPVGAAPARIVEILGGIGWGFACLCLVAYLTMHWKMRRAAKARMVQESKFLRPLLRARRR